MKDCKKIHLMLSLYTEGQLSTKEKSLVDKHLAFCVTARREMEKLGGLRQILKDTPEPRMPQDLHEKIMARVRGNVLPIPKPRGFLTYTPWALGTAAVLAFLILNQDSDWMDHWKVSAPRESRDETGVLRRQIEPMPSQLANAPAPQRKAPATQNFAKEQPIPKDATANEILDRESADQKLSEVRPDKNLGLNRKKTESYRADATSQPMAGLASAPAVEKPSIAGNLNQTDLLEKKAAVAQAPPAPKAMVANPALPPSSDLPSAPAGTASGNEMSLKTVTLSKEISAQTWSGNNQPATVENQELVTDLDKWKSYWQTLNPGQPLPQVDFTTQAVVLLTAGEKPTAGYSIHVSRLEEKTDQLVIWYKTMAPPQGSVLAQVLTHPWSMQVIPKPAKPVVFQKEQ